MTVQVMTRIRLRRRFSAVGSSVAVDGRAAASGSGGVAGGSAASARSPGSSSGRGSAASTASAVLVAASSTSGASVTAAKAYDTSVSAAAMQARPNSRTLSQRSAGSLRKAFMTAADSAFGTSSGSGGGSWERWRYMMDRAASETNGGAPVRHS